MEPKSTPRVPLVVVAWHDASYCEFREYDPKSPPTAVGQIQWSVGWLIRDDAEGIVLGVELSEYDGSFRHTLEIPRAYIKLVRPLTFARARKRDASKVYSSSDVPRTDP